MTLVNLSSFGAILTGREFGKKVMDELKMKLQYPVILDFSNVISLGSSFGDEVVVPIAKTQESPVVIQNANKAIWDCLTQIMEDHQIKLEKIP